MGQKRLQYKLAGEVRVGHDKFDRQKTVGGERLYQIGAQNTLISIFGNGRVSHLNKVINNINNQIKIIILM